MLVGSEITQCCKMNSETPLARDRLPCLGFQRPGLGQASPQSLLSRIPEYQRGEACNMLLVTTVGAMDGSQLNLTVEVPEQVAEVSCLRFGRPGLG